MEAKAIIYNYDHDRNIMTDGQKWFMYYITAQKNLEDFEKNYQSMKHYSKKNWAPSECRDCGDRIQKKADCILFSRHKPDEYCYVIPLQKLTSG